MLRKKTKYKILIFGAWLLFFIVIMILDYSNKQQIKEIDKQLDISQNLLNQYNNDVYEFNNNIDYIASQHNIFADNLILNDSYVEIKEVTKPKSSITYTQEEFDMLCATVMAEVGYCSVESQQLVTSVILNRVKSDKFPSTIKEVLTADNQFAGVRNHYTNKIPVTNELKLTVLDVLNSNTDYAKGSVYYYAPHYTNKKLSRWFESGLSFVMEFEGQRYFKSKEVSKN